MSRVTKQIILKKSCMRENTTLSTCANNKLYAATNGFFSNTKMKKKKIWEGGLGGGWVGSNHVKISESGPLQSSDGRQE